MNTYTAASNGHPTQPQVYIHPTAQVSEQARIGAGTYIWSHVQVREHAVIGSQCIVGKDVYIDAGVVIGNRVKIQNSSLLYQGVIVSDGVFVGPRVCFTNDRYPRAIRPDGQLKGAEDWVVTPIHVGYGASLGAGAVIVAGADIGRFAMVGAGAVVTHSVPDHGMVLGVPARLSGYVCRCGLPLLMDGEIGWCPICKFTLDIGA